MASKKASDCSAEDDKDGKLSEKTSCEWRLEEKTGDLFQCPTQTSLAHCVSADLHMGKGIAVIFKNKFGRTEELKKQEKGIGDVAILKVDDRYVYYLVTKAKYYQKPTYETLRQSLTAMRDHCVGNNVTSVAMPRIGCGLDKLEFHRVQQILREVFSPTSISITIYTL